MKKNRKHNSDEAGQAAKTKANAAVKPKAIQEQVEDDSRIDYGGLPNRDLKKNLGGCG